MSKTTLPRLSERQFQRQVIQLARLHQWSFVHFRPARTSKGWRTPVQGEGAGWPDLVLCRSRNGQTRLIFVELKADDGVLSQEQLAWGQLLVGVGGRVAYHCWRPKDWDLIQEVLR